MSRAPLAHLQGVAAAAAGRGRVPPPIWAGLVCLSVIELCRSGGGERDLGALQIYRRFR